ncbi:MAG TPA: hypothetical protein CFH84_01750 [Sulfurimonas sp. UBA12504]|nr:MAG: hypothetical protein A2019_01475 [Sulfurimonas sp. GWF2_37_8]DAB30824.1 MAG TPA: hypothetical protein CFH84_01750 [Sulfurimonas sp. UBA12504]
MKKIVMMIFFPIYLIAYEPTSGLTDIHGFVPKEQRIVLKLGIEAVNDTIDVLNMKESEFSSNTAGIDTLGNMHGYNVELGYGVKKFYFNFVFNQKNLQYLGATLTNNYFGGYGRYEIVKKKQGALAFDVGYETNNAKNSFITDETAINDTIKRAFPDQTITIKNKVLTQVDNGVTKTTNLLLNPYVALLDTKDEALYFRGVVSFWRKNFIADFFGGYKQIKINNTIDSSIAHEEQLETELQNGDLKANYTADREDGMLFGGFNLGMKYKQFFTEFRYQYYQMLRIDCLEGTNNNHVIDLNFLYNYNQNFAVYLGGHMMTNQFNGEIHYLYTQYTKTTFDHKYGYIRSGIVYKF